MDTMKQHLPTWKIVALLLLLFVFAAAALWVNR
jgi:predicted S18 family serine protease